MLKYQTIADELHHAILNGKYLPGSQLPLEKEMCEQYQVSRITIKRAVDELVKLGLVVKRRGSGTFVKTVDNSRLREFSMAHQFSGFVETFKGREVQTDVLKFEIKHPSEEVAVKLQISAEDFVYDIIRVRSLESQPMVIEYTNMPIQVVPGIRREVLENSIYHYIEDELKHRLQSAHRSVRAVMPTEEEKRYLKIEGILPLLEIEQVAFLDDGHPFEYSVARHRSDKQTFFAVSIR